jgi:hypothetical protein
MQITALLTRVIARYGLRPQRRLNILPSFPGRVGSSSDVCVNCADPSLPQVHL